MASFITVDRKILKWEWYQDVKVFHLFLYLLLRANWEDGNWRGKQIKRGQLITSRSTLSKETGLTERQVRGTLDKLKTTNEVSIKATNKFTIITICKYDTYQSKFSNINQKTPTERPTERPINDQQNVRQTATNNNINNKEQEENIQRDIPQGVKPPYYPIKDNFNGLPDLTYENIWRLIRSTKNIEVDKETINPLWEVFKDQNLTGKKVYADDADVYRHFINWTNKQSFRKKAVPKTPKLKEQIIGVEFINDFTQVKMTDGSIKDLTVNQKESAKFNQINPGAIKK